MYDSKYHYDNNFFHNPIIGDDFYIYQLGELYSNEKTAFKEHRQRCDEISLILSGRGYFYSDGKKIDVQPGGCIILKIRTANRCVFISAVSLQKVSGRKK